MASEVKILRNGPVIFPIAEMQLSTLGVEDMMYWVKDHRPECLPTEGCEWMALFPHGGIDEVTNRDLTANELLVELAGRKCYDSFGQKAGRRGNREYIAHTQEGETPHASVLYHAKMTFFFAGISRRVSHEIIRNYVGSDRNEEGSPSQESTRFTHHYGFFVEPPRYSEERPEMQTLFQEAMQTAYTFYCTAVEQDIQQFISTHGMEPKGLARKRIYEAAASLLPHQAETSFIWTTNPAAIAKFVREREAETADLEIQRFAQAWRQVCVRRWPNLFPQPWMQKE